MVYVHSTLKGQSLESIIALAIATFKDSAFDFSNLLIVIFLPLFLSISSLIPFASPPKTIILFDDLFSTSILSPSNVVKYNL